MTSFVRIERGLAARIAAVTALIVLALACVGTAPAGALAASGTTGTVKAETAKRPPSCPAGSTCQVVTITCPDVQASRTATVALGAPTSKVRRGVVALFTGGSGSSFWGAETAVAGTMVTKLRAAGFEVVQVRWHQSWLASASGEVAGSAALACRPATMIRWIHDTRFVPMKLPTAAPGVCGFCVSGSSGGASAVTYALSHYGLDALVDGVFPTGGPPHAALAKGCARTAGEEPYWYDGASVKTIDSSYGYPKGGPCLAHDASFAPNWAADSVELGGTDYAYPATRVQLLVGSLDPVMLRHAEDYAAVLTASGTAAPIEVVPKMGHDISDFAAGVDRLYALLVQASAEL